MRSRTVGLAVLLLLSAESIVPKTFDLTRGIESIPALAQTVEAVKAEDDSRKQRGEANRLNHQALEQFEASQFEAAIQSWQRALILYRQVKNRLGEGYALGNLGLAYDSLSNYGKAIEYHQQHLAIARELKDRLGEGMALGNLGVAYDSLGNYGKAIEYQQQRLAIARELKDRLGEGQSLGNLGLAYDSLGNYGKAIEYQQQSLAIARELKNRLGEGASLGNLGLAYYSLGNYSKAIEYHQQSLAIDLEIKNRLGEGYALGNLGLAYYSLGNYSKAIEYQQQSLAIKREIKDRLGEGQSLGNLGLAYYSLGNYGKAIEYYQQSLATKREIRDRPGEGWSLNNLGSVLLKSGKLTEAERVLFEGIQVLESLRQGLNDANKVSIFEQQSSTYRTLQQVLIAQNKPAAALEIAERGRARAFVELLSSRVQAGETRDQSQTAIAPIKLAAIQQIAQTQKATLVEYSIIYDDFKLEGKQQTRESELYIWVVKPSGEINFRKANLKPLWQKQQSSLADLVFSGRDAIGVRGRGVAFRENSVIAQVQSGTVKNAELRQLHRLLIQPIADLLPTNPAERVIFLPQGSLFLVPFAALQEESGKYLIERHTILTAPAIQVLALTRQQRQKLAGNRQNDVLIVGNPTMPKVTFKVGEPAQQLTSLPGSEQEAKTIGTLFKIPPLIGKQATKAAIVQRLTSARIVHLATHGLLDDFRGLGVPGAIALAPAAGDDGLLTANEILDLKLNAELVVLSACDTGRGTITGDGVIGLSRALITAGAPSIIVSLWKVPDEPTAELMTQFYRNWQQQPDKAQALRQAMLQTMEQYPDPEAWAAFTLIGEAE